MKRILLIAIAAIFPLLASAQITTNPLETELGARVGLTLDKKLAKGLHLQLEGEARTAGNFTDWPLRRRAGPYLQAESDFQVRPRLQYDREEKF